MDITQVATPTQRVERHWISGKKEDLVVYTIPVAHLYFNIENGRYADRMLKLRRDNPGVVIDPKDEEWKKKIEALLAGEGEGTSRDKAAFERLMEDLQAREQLRPGVVLGDGGVIDGNRRLAALRRLWSNSKNTSRFSTFDAVILPGKTTAEDRWRIEAGLQLGVQERWDYSPVNELLKIREGLSMYQQMIDAGLAPPNETAADLVAKSIYGRSPENVREMAARLQLIDAYLAFIGDPGAYDRINDVGEAFLEARKVMTAAENQQRPPVFLAKLQAVLFYVIHTGEMNNYDIRDIYTALGGDPRKRGRKANAHPEELDEFLGNYPDARDIRKAISVEKFEPDVLGRDEDEDEDEDADEDSADPVASDADAPGDTTRAHGDEDEDENLAPGPDVSSTDTSATDAEGPDSPSGPDENGGRVRKHGSSAGGGANGPIDKDKVGGANERFKRRMKASKKRQSVRKLAEGARTDIENLEKRLGDQNEVKHLTDGDRTSILDTLDSTASAVARCRTLLEV